MKISMPSADSMNTRVFNADGSEVRGIRKITVTAEAGLPVQADIEMALVDSTSVEDAEATFIVGAHRNVVSLVLADGRVVPLSDKRKGEIHAC